jgi:exonuclease VII small subunit
MFEEGVSLVRLCGDKLDRAEQRIKILVSNGDGEMIEQDFAPASAR